MKILSTYSGCKVAVQVRQNILPDNSVVYEPFIPFAENLNIYIQLSKKNNEFDSYTTKLVTIPLPSMYLFSNENLPGPRAFPFLTNTVSAFNAGNFYEQGQLASFGVNDIRENFKNDVGDQWQKVTGNSFANESDRLVVPLKFYYSFNGVTNIKQAAFTVKDKNGHTIKTISIGSTDPVQKVLLDFSDKTDKLSLPETSLLSDFIFSLGVSGNDGYSKNFKVIFNDVLYNTSCAGVINIKPKPTNPLFSLFANDGFLIRRKSPLGIWKDAPVFEIPVKSLFTYWRYINDKGKELKLIPALTDYLFKENKILMTIKPRPVSNYYFLLQNELNTDTKYAPNPISYELKKDNKERLYFDVIVPESELFPIL